MIAPATFYPPAEAARVLGVSARTLRRLMADTLAAGIRRQRRELADARGHARPPRALADARLCPWDVRKPARFPVALFPQPCYRGTMPRKKKPTFGRPPIPASERRTKRLVVLFTVAEWAQLTRASDDPRLPLWARRYLLAAPAATENGKK